MEKAVSVSSTIFLFLFFLTGCTFNPFTTHNQTTGSATGAIVGGALGAGSVALFGGSKTMIVAAGIGGGMLGYYVTTLQYESGGILHAGGQVYKMGDYLGIDIPSDKLFEPNTADFLPQARPILDSAITVLSRMPDNNIMISGNTSGFGRAHWEQKLSEKRAGRVAAYLWNGGITQFKKDSIRLRKLNYVGYGNYFPIANDYTNESLRQNSHIQITSYPDNRELASGRAHSMSPNIGDPLED